MASVRIRLGLYSNCIGYGISAWVPLVVLSIAGMATGIGSGVVALVAILRSRERAVAVWLCLVPGAFALLFVLGKFLFPH